MRENKKITSLFIALMMAVAMCLCFAGCGSSDDAADSAADSSAQTAAEHDPSNPNDAWPQPSADAVAETAVGVVDLATAQDSPAFVGKLKQAKKADQLFVVAAMSKTTAYVSMHQKDENGNWKQILTTPGYIGKYGLNKTKEGDAKTPTGTYHFNYAFGIAPDPGCTAFEYQQVTDDDYWSGDQADGHHYNEMVSIQDIPDLDTDNSEHIVDYPVHYQYCMNISWNEKGKAGKGSAIFLHCLGPQKPYTGGCVAIPEDKVITAIRNVQEDCVIVIDKIQNIAPDLVEEWDL